MLCSETRKRELIIGVSVSETSADTRIVTETVMANSRNSRPTMPLISSSGMNTAIRLMLIETMVKPISDAPFSAASNGFSPSSIWRTMFSSMTIASSTTKPTAIVSPIRLRLSRLNPSRYIAPNVPTRATGIVTLGMIVAQTLRRNRKITITTSPIESSSVNSTSVTEARMVWVRSEATWTLMSGGMLFSSCGSFASTPSTVSMTLAPGCLKMISSTPGLLFCQAASCEFCGPLIALPMSLIRIGPVPR